MLTLLVGVVLLNENVAEVGRGAERNEHEEDDDARALLGRRARGDQVKVKTVDEQKDKAGDS